MMPHQGNGQAPYIPPMSAYGQQPHMQQASNMPPPQQQQQQQPPTPHMQQQQHPSSQQQQQQQPDDSQQGDPYGMRTAGAAAAGGAVVPASASGAGGVRMDALDPFSAVHDGKLYKLVVVQEPVRARMCGFGDKDRRPITPPPCVKLVVTDIKTQLEVPAEDFNVNFFVLTVDLWDESGTKEVNLVRHSATSPSISAATSSSYPPPSAPVYPYSANTAAAANAHQVAAAQATGMQVHVGMTSPGYGPSSYGPHHSAPYMSQPPNGPGGHPGAPGGPPAMAAYAHHQHQAAPQPVNGGSRAPEPQSYYVSQTGQPTGAVQYPNAAVAAYGMPPAYQGHQMSSMLSPHAAPMDPRSAPSGMFTRNLIGSLAVNGNLLKDPQGKTGIWFILQDLSVRTEGVFRLKMRFCDIADPSQPNTLNGGRVNILADTYTAPFQVYSAKKFPGVIESTPLSKCFAMQGVKIPIRKDGPSGKAAEVDEDEDN